MLLLILNSLWKPYAEQINEHVCAWSRCVWPGGRRFKKPALDFFFVPSTVPSSFTTSFNHLKAPSLSSSLPSLRLYSLPLSLSLIAALPRCVFNHRLSSAGNSVTKDRRRASLSDTPPYLGVCVSASHTQHRHPSHWQAATPPFPSHSEIYADPRARILY